jgi:hypothetical protein
MILIGIVYLRRLTDADPGQSICAEAKPSHKTWTSLRNIRVQGLELSKHRIDSDLRLRKDLRNRAGEVPVCCLKAREKWH